jgi:iron complex outermembrane recepter protein
VDVVLRQARTLGWKRQESDSCPPFPVVAELFHGEQKGRHRWVLPFRFLTTRHRGRNAGGQTRLTTAVHHGGLLSIILRLVVAFSLICCLLNNSRAESQEPACPQGGRSKDKDQSGAAAPAPSVASCEKQDIAARRESIVVTGTFTPVPAQDIDRSITVADTRDQPTLYTHWVNYLQLVPSVDLQQRAPDGVQADLSIRGSTFEQTLVLLNGLRMNDVQTSHHDLDLPLPTSSLQRIEILPGAGSTFYGSDAVGGTINFITGPPQYSEVRVGAAVGNFGVNQEIMSAGFVSSRLDEQLSVARDFSSGFMQDRDYRSLTIFSDSGAQTVLGHTLIMLGYGDKPFGANQFYGDFNSWERTKSWFAGLKQDLGSKTEFDLGYRRHTDEFVLLRDDPSFYENNHIDESWQVALRRTQTLGQNSTLFYGGEGFYESIQSNNLGDHARSRGAVYADYDVRALGRFSFSLGAREEVFDTGRPELSPTLAVGLWLKGGWKVKGSASRAFRLPTYTDLYYHDPATLGNSNLLPETAWSYEGGLLWDHKDRYKAAITVFERRVENDIDYVRASSADLWHAENLGRVDFAGVEMSFELRLPHRQRLTVSYTGLYGAQSALNGLESEYVFNYPVNDAVIGWQGSLPGNLVARSRIGVTERYARDPYTLWDASIGREFHHADVHLAFSNLTNSQYQEVEGVAMPGRSVVFGMDLFKTGTKR